MDDTTRHIPWISIEEIRKGIISFPPGSSGGPDGLTPGHLKTLISRDASEAGNELLEALRRFATHVARGDVPLPIREFFFGAALCALSKGDGGVRPIAVGCTLRRLTTKVIMQPLSGNLGAKLRPTQLGYGTRGGCEAAVHAARHLLETSTEPLVFVKLDIRSAFNTIKRDLMQAVEANIPTAYPYFHAA